MALPPLNCFPKNKVAKLCNNMKVETFLFCMAMLMAIVVAQELTIPVGLDGKDTLTTIRNIDAQGMTWATNQLTGGASTQRKATQTKAPEPDPMVTPPEMASFIHIPMGREADVQSSSPTNLVSKLWIRPVSRYQRTGTGPRSAPGPGVPSNISYHRFICGWGRGPCEEYGWSYTRNVDKYKALDENRGPRMDHYMSKESPENSVDEIVREGSKIATFYDFKTVMTVLRKFTIEDKFEVCMVIHFYLEKIERK
ncbi:hypothetical protein CEXT_636331, partial [Caerostris extrusa]